MIPFYLYLGVTLFVWVRRAVLMMDSIKKYSCIPKRPWNPKEESDLVSVIVPCRNEALNLPLLVPSLLAQDYPRLELIFLDDRSSDNTHAVLSSFQAQDNRIQVLKGKPLPEGWTGKNHAMAQCVEAAKGSWVLFTDADTVHEPYSVSSCIRYAREKKLDLLTLSARCVCRSFAEHLIQPMGIGCFSVWFKLEDVNNPNSGVPLACGQYLLIQKKVYLDVGGSARVRSEVTEDLALFKVIKDSGWRCELAIGSHLFATRMYQTLRESWVGWRRIYLHALQKDVGSILQKMAMLVIFSFLPFFFFLSFAVQWVMKSPDAGLPAFLAGALCAFILFLRSRSHSALRASQWSILLHPLSALTIFGILSDCLWHHFSGRKVVWKMQKY